MPLLVPLLFAGGGLGVGFIGAGGTESIAKTAKYVAIGGALFLTAKYMKVI